MIKKEPLLCSVSFCPYKTLQITRSSVFKCILIQYYLNLTDKALVQIMAMIAMRQAYISFYLYLCL